jgi:UDP-GlcNAc:undecaprenyl-phosphate GlcNAc-1-phosphate transferase
MGIFNNPALLENLAKISTLIGVGFLLTFLITPLVGYLAQKMGAVDLPASQRKRGERGITTRIHSYPYAKLGGLGMVIVFLLIGILLPLEIEGVKQSLLSYLSQSSLQFFFIIVGVLIIALLGFLDDVYEISAPVQFGMQFLAALAVVLGGTTITSINLFGLNISLNWLPTYVFNLGNFEFSLILPGALITILWIVGVINVVNWVGGVDALNGSVSSIMLFSLMVLILTTGNVGVAFLVALYLGTVLGVLPYNWNPGKIMYGSIGDYLNGYILAILAIIGGAKWGATMLVLGLPILDGLYVFYNRWKDNPKYRTNPIKLLSLSGYNHFHHRILAAGYSKKMVVLIESTIVFLICTAVLFFSDINQEYYALILGLAILLVSFTVIAFLMKRAAKNKKLRLAAQLLQEEDRREAVVNVVLDADKENEEKFIY